MPKLPSITGAVFSTGTGITVDSSCLRLEAGIRLGGIVGPACISYTSEGLMIVKPPEV